MKSSEPDLLFTDIFTACITGMHEDIDRVDGEMLSYYNKCRY